MSRGESRRTVGVGIPPWNQLRGRLFAMVCLLASVLPVVLGALWLGALLQHQSGLPESVSVVDMDRWLNGGPDGLFSSVVGSLWLVSLCLVIAVPLGVAAALHLEGPRRRGPALLAFNLANLTAVPSVVYGLVGYEIFVQTLRLGHNLVAAAFTLSLVVLPIVAVASRSALRAVPDELREAGFALGGTPWQVTRQIVLPIALPGVLSGSILAIARAFGEAAPLLLVTGLAVAGPSTAALGDPHHVLPLYVFEVLSDPHGASQANAVAGVVVLLGTLIVLSGWAVLLRRRYERRRDR